MVKKIESIGTKGSYGPAVLLDDVANYVGNLEFIVVGMVTKSGDFIPAWSSHKHPAPMVALCTDMLKAENLKRNGNG